MGSRNADGTKIFFDDYVTRHKGFLIDLTSASGTDSQIANTSYSVEREKHTIGGAPSGAFEWEVTRGYGIHTSVSYVRASGALGPSVPNREAKIFGKGTRGDWTIFDASGDAVGTPTGTTDTDITPAAW